jgi:hypothetical protein
LRPTVAAFGNVAQWVSALCGLVTLYFASNIFEQLKVTRQASEIQAWQMVARPQGDISAILVRSPQLWPYFQEKKAPPDRQTEPERYSQVMALADMYLEWIDTFEDPLITRLEGMEEGGKVRALWDETFKTLFATSPALCLRLQQTRTFYQEHLKQYARAAGCSV